MIQYITIGNANKNTHKSVKSSAFLENKNGPSMYSKPLRGDL